MMYVLVSNHVSHRHDWRTTNTKTNMKTQRSSSMAVLRLNAVKRIKNLLEHGRGGGSAGRGTAGGHTPRVLAGPFFFGGGGGNSFLISHGPFLTNLGPVTFHSTLRNPSTLRQARLRSVACPCCVQAERLVPKRKWLQLGRHHSAWQRVRALRGHSRAKVTRENVGQVLRKAKDKACQLQWARHRVRDAVRWHDVIGARRRRTKGAGLYKAWLPSAFLRCGFSAAAVPNQTIASRMRVAPAQVAACRMAVAALAYDSQRTCLSHMLRHLLEQPPGPPLS